MISCYQNSIMYTTKHTTRLVWSADNHGIARRIAYLSQDSTTRVRLELEF
jgi:hypothetical protein